MSYYSFRSMSRHDTLPVVLQGILYKKNHFYEYIYIYIYIYI